MHNIKDHIHNVSGKTVIIRCNFDVPIENSEVQDTTRIEDAIPTIKLVLEHGNKVILLAHAGRPEAQESEFSLRPIVPILTKLLEQNIDFIDYKDDFKQVTVPSGHVFLLENLRFWKEEEANDPVFSQFLASLGEVYINEAFANCHRKHASIVGIPQHLPSYAGLSLFKEIQIISKIKNDPDKPLVVVLGGAKLETKEPLVNAFSDTADSILVGGKIALDLREHPHATKDNVIIADLTESGKDITKESADDFAKRISEAKTVVWNGTMGVFEEEEHALGTKIVAEAVNNTPAYTLVGGGDTEAAMTVFRKQDKIDHISTGGGAMLTLLVDGHLPGVDVLS